MVRLNPSSLLDRLGSAIFAEMNEWKEEARRSGLDIIDLGIGSPDRPPSPRVIETLSEAVRNPRSYGYPSSEGSLKFRETVSRWYAARFGVSLDPETEVVTLMGSQDGLAHLAMSITEPGDTAIIPDPGYPIYAASLAIAGLEAHTVALTEEHAFVPQWDHIPSEIAHKAKFIILNFPSNPTTAVVDLKFFEQAVAFARQHNLLIVHDLAYSEMAFDGYHPPSILQVKGAKDVCVEFHSLSKSYNMAGCRIGFMVGHQDVVRALKRLKSNIDYGVFLPIQQAGIAALEEDLMSDDTISHLYERRRNLIVDGLVEAGWRVHMPKATMFLWAPVPHGESSRQISREILFHTGVAMVPGDAFGRQGEGYVRIALVHEEERLMEAVDRIDRFMKSKP